MTDDARAKAGLDPATIERTSYVLLSDQSRPGSHSVGHTGPPATGSPAPHDVDPGRRFGDQAMLALRRSVAGGFMIWEVFRSDPNLGPLRNRADFQFLLMDLAFPADPFAQ